MKHKYEKEKIRTLAKGDQMFINYGDDVVLNETVDDDCSYVIKVVIEWEKKALPQKRRAFAARG